MKYLGKVSEPSGGEDIEQADVVLREGLVHYILSHLIIFIGARYMVKRGQARKKFGLKNFKTR